MTTRRIVCLANSRKPGGRCIAGRFVDARNRPWVRPIGQQPLGALAPHECQLPDGTQPTPLDILEIDLDQPLPGPTQPENWSLEGQATWRRIGVLPVHDLHDLIGDDGLWTPGSSSSQCLNNRMPAPKTAECSLKLIRVDQLLVRCFTESDGATRMQVRFVHAEERYALHVTDPAFEHRYRDVSLRRLGASYLTVSLSEPFYGHCYKLVAAVLAADE